MTEKVLLSDPEFQFFDQNGDPLAGGKVFIYEAGTTTKIETWADPEGLTSNTNPIILDAEGKCRIYVNPANPIEVSPLPAGPPGPQGPDGPPGPPGPTGNASEFSNTVDITSAQIYDWFGNYIEIVPAVDGTILIPEKVYLGYKYRTVPYATNSANFVLSWGIPFTVPNGTFAATILEQTQDETLVLLDLTGLAGLVLTNSACLGLPLNLTLDAAVDGAPLISIMPFDGGTSYAVGDTGTIDGGDGLATYIVTSETAGVVDGITLTAGGLGYSSDTEVTTTVGGGQPGTGTGLTLTTTSAETIGSALRVTSYYRRFLPLT